MKIMFSTMMTGKIAAAFIPEDDQEVEILQNLSGLGTAMEKETAVLIDMTNFFATNPVLGTISHAPKTTGETTDEASESKGEVNQ